jgi:hypothetical protein
MEEKGTRVIFTKLGLATSLLVAGAWAHGTHAQAIACQSGKPQQVAELMFGRKIDDRIGVSNAAWSRFVDREITPRFPDGLTIIDASGQWRDRSRNKVVREPSKLVQIVLPGKGADQQRLNEIVQAYKVRFRQQSVLVIVRPACITF